MGDALQVKRIKFKNNYRSGHGWRRKEHVSGYEWERRELVSGHEWERRERERERACQWS